MEEIELMASVFRSPAPLETGWQENCLLLNERNKHQKFRFSKDSDSTDSMTYRIASQPQKIMSGAPRDQRRALFPLFWGLLVFVLSGCGGGGSSNRPIDVEAQRSIVFQSDRDGDSEILRMNGDGSRLIRVTENTVADVTPSFSVDGQSIVFASDRSGKREIYIIDSQGTRQLTDNNFIDDQPLLSADGKKVVFRSKRGPNFQLFSIELQNKQENQITPADYDIQNANFSPNGNIVFSALFNSRSFHIYEINSNTNQIKQLTFDRSSNVFPTASPDDKQIAFASGLEGSLDIYLMDRATGFTKALTSNSQNNTEPIFSRDGQRLFFSSNRTGNYDIYSMKIDGTDVRNLTNNPASDRVPSVR